MAATDLAILTAFCRPYFFGDQRFASPAPNNEILRELCQNGVDLDLDALRGHLRNVYVKFGVEDGLNPAQKRARLAQLVYESNVIPGWGRDEETLAATGSPVTSPATEPPADPTSPAPVPMPRSRMSRFTRFPRQRLWLGAGIAVLLAGMTAAFVGLAGREPAPHRAGAPGPPVIDPAAMSDAEGTVTYCTGEDTVTSSDGRTQHRAAVAAFNARFGSDVHANLRQFSDDASQQYAQITQLLREHSGDCDVIYADVVWSADFAHNKWLYDLTPYAPRSSLKRYVDAMQEAVVYRDRVWGVPKQADAAVLYYNTSSVRRPPRTWQDLYAQAKVGPGKRLRYQGFAYEGLTVNFLELAYAIGATDIVTPDGEANINQPAALLALQFMVDGIRDGAAPRVIVNQKEKQSLNAFGGARAAFMRNWAPVYAALEDRRGYPKVAGSVGVVPLPSWGGGPPVSVLGGHVLVVSAFSRKPAAALKLVDFLSSAQAVKQDAIDFSLAPALVDQWEDPEIQKALPIFGDLKSAVFNAKSRPVTPNYSAVSRAIYTNVNRALQGYQEPQDALKQADDEMRRALRQITRVP